MHGWRRNSPRTTTKLKQDIEREDFDGGGGEDSDDEVRHSSRSRCSRMEVMKLLYSA